jgi:hypothetical protein
MATTTPNYGWDVPTSTDYVKDGATAIETLGDDIDATLYTALGGNYPGLRLISSVTFTSQTTISLNSIFSATYDNYLLDYRIDTGVSTNVTCKMNNGGTPTSGGTDYAFSRIFWTGTGGTGNNGGSAGGADFALMSVSTTTPANGSINIYSPFRASPTGFNGISSYATLGEIMYAKHALSTSYNGLTLVAGSAISGTFRVYGKAQS